MSAFAATARRDAWQALVGGRAWSFAVALAALTGLPLAANASTRTGVADFIPSFSIGAWCVLVAAALLGASSISSERRHATWDLVLAAPPRPSATLWAKWLALAVSVGVLLVGFPLQAAIESLHNTVDWASLLGGMFGLWCMGLAAGAIGIAAGVVVRSGLGATALALLAVGVWVSVTRSMQVLGEPWNAAVGFALDPIRRTQQFSSGTIDAGSVITLLGVAFSFTWMAARWADTERRPTRLGAWQRRASALVMALIAMVVVGVAARGPGVISPAINLHHLLHHSASNALRAAVMNAQGPVHITLLTAKNLGDQANAAARAAMERARTCRDHQGGLVQINEVDLLAPAQAGEAAQVVERIALSESEAVTAWKLAFTSALAALDAVCLSGDLAAPLNQIASTRGQGDAMSPRLLALAAALTRGMSEGTQWHDAFEAAAAPIAERPLGDIEGASRALAAELAVWAQILRDGAGTLAQGAVSPPQRDAARRLATLSDDCRAAQDTIERLAPLRLAEVASALRTPPVVIVSSARGSAAIPAWRLLEGETSADYAMAETFAAAQGAMRNAIVFVQAAQRSPLEATASGADFAFVTEALRATRFRVEAWNPTQSARPSIRNAQRRAWVIVPPLERRSLEADANEQALLAATRRLIEEGESVFLLATPSISATLGMVDAWSELLRGFGLTARTEAMVVQLLARSESSRELRTALEDVQPGDSAIADVMRGRVQWPLPMPLRVEAVAGVRNEVVAMAPPLPSIWIEDDPRVVTRGAAEVPADKALQPGQIVPLLAVAQSATNPNTRVAISGGAAWPMTGTAGVADARGMLRSPGNRDLFVGILRWLVHDDSVVQDLPPMDRGASRRSFAVVWLPSLSMLCCFVGIAAWRRRA